MQGIMKKPIFSTRVSKKDWLTDSKARSQVTKPESKATNKNKWKKKKKEPAAQLTQVSYYCKAL